MTFIRRSLLAATLAIIAACSSIQAPEPPKVVPVVTPLESKISGSTTLTARDLSVSTAISSKYKCKTEVANQVVLSAKEHSFKDFPTRDDILAIVAIESRFNPFARQGGSFGLMQVLVKTHKDLIRDKNSVSDQIRVGSNILRQYYVDSGKSKSAAIMSYNSGPGAYRIGVRATKYYKKYDEHLHWVKAQYKVQDL